MDLQKKQAGDRWRSELRKLRVREGQLTKKLLELEREYERLDREREEVLNRQIRLAGRGYW